MWAHRGLGAYCWAATDPRAASRRSKDGSLIHVPEMRKQGIALTKVFIGSKRRAMEAASSSCPGPKWKTGGRGDRRALPDSSPGQPRLLPANSRRMEGAELPADEAPDPRVQRLLRRAARGLRLPAGSGAGGGEAAAELWAFAAGAAGRALLAWRGPAGRLALGPPPPPAAAARPKALFFLRPPGPGEPLCGDLPADALQHFAALVEEVRRESGVGSAPVRGWAAGIRRFLGSRPRMRGARPWPLAPTLRQPRASASQPLGKSASSSHLTYSSLVVV